MGARNVIAFDTDIPEDYWEDCSENLEFPRAWLHSTAVINGVYHRVEAIEVTVDGNGVQRAVDPALEDSFCEYHSAAGAEGHMQTVTIKGQEYCIFISPFC